MMIRDIQKAEKLSAQDKRYLRTILRLFNLCINKPCSFQTKYEQEAMDQVVRFIDEGIIG